MDTCISPCKAELSQLEQVTYNDHQATGDFEMNPAHVHSNYILKLLDLEMIAKLSWEHMNSQFMNRVIITKSGWQAQVMA
jgi:hypothetical protein